MFSKRKKKNRKLTIRDALAPIPAFIAVPSTPQPFSRAGAMAADNSPAPIPLTAASLPPGVTLHDGFRVNGDENDGDVIVHAAALAEDLERNVTVTRGTQSAWPKDGSSGNESNESDAVAGYSTIKKVERAQKSDGVKSDRPLPGILSNGGQARAYDLDVGNPVILPDPVTSHKKQSPGSDSKIPHYTKVNKHTKTPRDSKTAFHHIEPLHSDPSHSRRYKRKEHYNTDSPWTREKHSSDELKREEREKERMIAYLKIKGEARKKTVASAHQHQKEVIALEQGRPQREVVEYTDEDYNPTGDDSFSITETTFSEWDIHNHLNSSNHSSRESHRKPKSASGYRSADPDTQRTKVMRDDQKAERSISAPPEILDGNIPYIKPLSVHQLAPEQSSGPQDDDEGVIVFSEKLADGSIQYYAATPVNGSSPYHTPSTSQPSLRTSATPSLATPKPSSGTIVTESGYYSNPALGHSAAPSLVRTSTPLLGSLDQSHQDRSLQGGHSYPQHQDRSLQSHSHPQHWDRSLQSHSHPQHQDRSLQGSHSHPQHQGRSLQSHSHPQHRDRSLQSHSHPQHQDRSLQGSLQHHGESLQSHSHPQHRDRSLHSHSYPQHQDRSLQDQSNHSSYPQHQGRPLQGTRITKLGSPIRKTASSPLPTKLVPEIVTFESSPSRVRASTEVEARQMREVGGQLAVNQQALKIKEIQISTLKEQIQALQEENGRLLDEKQSLEVNRIKIKQEQQIVKGERAVLSKKLEHMRDQVKQLKQSSQQDASNAELENEVQLLNISLDQQLAKEKQQLRATESQISNLKGEVAGLQDINRKLINDKQCLEMDKIKLEDQSQSLEFENRNLDKRLQLVKEKMQELKLSNQAEASKLRVELESMKCERDVMETQLIALSESHVKLQKQLERYLDSLPGDHVSIKEHQEALANLQSLLVEQNESMLQTQKTHMKMQSKENAALLLEIAEAKAMIKRLEAENRSLLKTNRQGQELVAEIRFELECSKEREATAHNELSSALKKVDRVITEKDTFARLADTQRRTAEKAVASELENSMTIDNLQRKLEASEEELYQLNRSSHRSKKDNSHIRKQYEKEIKQLRNTLDRKQRHVEQMALEKRHALDKLDLVWKASTSPRSSFSTLQTPDLTSKAAKFDLLNSSGFKPSASITSYT